MVLSARLVRKNLRAALAKGVLPQSILVWQDGMTDWVPVSTIPELGLERTTEPATPEDATSLERQRSSTSMTDGVAPISQPTPFDRGLQEAPPSQPTGAQPLAKRRARHSTLIGVPPPSTPDPSPTGERLSIQAASGHPGEPDRAERAVHTTQIPPFGGPPAVDTENHEPRVPAPAAAGSLPSPPKEERSKPGPSPEESLAAPKVPALDNPATPDDPPRPHRTPERKPTMGVGWTAPVQAPRPSVLGQPERPEKGGATPTEPVAFPGRFRGKGRATGAGAKPTAKMRLDNAPRSPRFKPRRRATRAFRHATPRATERYPPNRPRAPRSVPGCYRPCEVQGRQARRRTEQ